MIHQHARAIGNALDGLKWAFSTQINYRVHILLSFIVIGAGVFFSISQMEWYVVSILIIGGFVIETVNTSIEQLGDAINTDFNVHIKRAKDLAAGAMLIHSIGATLIAACVFIPKIIIFILH